MDSFSKTAEYGNQGREYSGIVIHVNYALYIGRKKN